MAGRAAAARSGEGRRRRRGAAASAAAAAVRIGVGLGFRGAARVGWGAGVVVYKGRPEESRSGTAWSRLTFFLNNSNMQKK